MVDYVLVSAQGSRAGRTTGRTLDALNRIIQHRESGSTFRFAGDEATALIAAESGGRDRVETAKLGTTSRATSDDAAKPPLDSSGKPVTDLQAEWSCRRAVTARPWWGAAGRSNTRISSFSAA